MVKTRKTMTSAHTRKIQIPQKEVDAILKAIRSFHKTEKREYTEVFHDDDKEEDIPIRRIVKEEMNWNDDSRREQERIVHQLISKKKRLSSDELFKIHKVFERFNIDSFALLKELDSRNDPRGSFALYEMFSGPFRFDRHRNMTTAKKYLTKAAKLGFDKAKAELDKFASKKSQRFTRLDYWLQKGPAEDDIVASIGGLISQVMKPGERLSLSDLFSKMVEVRVDYDGYVDSCEWEGDKLHLSIKGTKTTHTSLRSYFLVVEEFGGRFFEEV